MIYPLAWLIAQPFFALLFRLKVLGAENLPRRGGALLAANHVSLLDPVVLGAAVRRRVYFMAKEELFRHPLLAALIRSLGAFPVRRGTADRRALNRATQLLAQGKVVGIFPEGTRSLDGQLQPPYAGVALLASRTGVPVIPAAILGTQNLLTKKGGFKVLTRLEVRLGPPLLPPPRGKRADRTLEEFSARVMEAIAHLMQAPQPQ
ncbi:MAG: lysophospholipid acyltransferase family protein [Bacillota bacterium]|nr:lysophospholipid acyltransferase family protein [Bacillota bacterium]